MQGLQRATEAARASRGLPPRTIHARSLSGGNLTLCGRGDVTIADEPGEVTGHLAGASPGVQAGDSPCPEMHGGETPPW
jgi:hypothetical protein